MTSVFEKFGLEEAQVLRDTHAQTAMRVAAVIGDSLELAIKSKLLADGKPVNEKMFKYDGRYSTLEKRLNGAHELGLIDEVTRDDGHLMRRARNAFGHATEPMHFDSKKIVNLLKQMSTYETAEYNQDAFLHAAGNVSEQALKAVKALRKQPA
jgi:DNA-binding MltR family transcriptional regulator